MTTIDTTEQGISDDPELLEQLRELADVTDATRAKLLRLAAAAIKAKAPNDTI